MLSDVIQKNCKEFEPLSKSESIKIQRKWLELFANRVKEKTGKWRTGDYLWSNFASGIQPAYSSSKAIELYKQQKLGLFYILDESGKHCFQCKSETLPEFYNTGYDLYLFPKDGNWTVVFCHDNVVYFSYAE